MMNWEAPQKPSEWAETRLIEAILDNTFAIDTNLPAERELAVLLGVTRPTLREALQRLARDGWVEIRHGHPTRVRDYWQEGQLAVLVAMTHYPHKLPANFVPQLLDVRLAMAPVYIHQAVSNNAAAVADFLEDYCHLEEIPAVYARADWELHHRLTVLSQNPVYTLMLNGFQGLYLEMGLRYFDALPARQASSRFYQDLLAATRAGDADRAGRLSAEVMKASIDFWHKLDRDQTGI
jgi:GntR family negative regulator for fad regulon and positive regulator of fabA